MKKIKESLKVFYDGNKFAIGLSVGIILTRIISSPLSIDNTIGAVAAGIVIPFIITIGYKIARD